MPITRQTKPTGTLTRVSQLMGMLCGEDVITCGNEYYTCGGSYIHPRVDKPTGTLVRQSEVT